MLGGFDAYPQAHLYWWCRFGDMRSSHRSGGEPDVNPGAHRSDAACPRGICRTPAIPLHGTAFEERMDYRTRTDVRRHFRKRGATPSHLCQNARIAGVNPLAWRPGFFCGPEFLCLRVRTFQSSRSFCTACGSTGLTSTGRRLPRNLTPKPGIREQYRHTGAISQGLGCNASGNGTAYPQIGSSAATMPCW
jgi:hypothetical protein